METTTSTPSMPVNTGNLRPTFLTVLCILTFIGSGWGVVSGIKNYITADTAAAMTSQIMADAQDKMDKQDTPSFAKSLLGSVSAGLSADNIRKSSIVSLISCLFTLVGAIMMWSLKKIGFYLYVVGCIIIVIGPMIVLGNGLLGMIGSAWSGFICVIFIVMYAVNLKYMNDSSPAAVNP